MRLPDDHRSTRHHHTLELRYVTENKPCHEADTPKVSTRSATPNDRPATAPAARPSSQRLSVRYRRPADRRSRPQRWHDAVAELLALQAEYTAWSDALPDRFRDTATAEALQAIVELDLDDLAAIIPPRGYGRD